MTEQNGRAYGGNGRSSALESAFGRPPGVESSFAPGAPPLTPPAPPPPPPAPGLRRLFSRPSGVADSFDPPPGAIRDTTPPPESPWWKPDADRDPWRDARSPASLGGPPDFGDGGPAPVGAPEEPAGRRRWGLRNITLTAAVVLLVAGLLTGIAGGVVGYWPPTGSPRRCSTRTRRCPRSAPRSTGRPARSPTSPSGCCRWSSRSR